MGMLGLVWRIATGPIWILWSAYKGLWWVFGDTHEKPDASRRPAKGDAAAVGAQQASFEVVDSSPRPIPAPVRLLRGGFAGSVLASLGLLLASNGLSAGGVMAPERAVAAWLWSSAIVAVGSIYLVRQAARRHRRKQGIAAMLRSVKEAAGGAVRGAHSACMWAAAKAGERVNRPAPAPADGSPAPARSVKEKVEQSFGGLRDRARRAWNAVGRATPETRTAA